MTGVIAWPGEVAHQMGLLPLVAVALKRADRAWWWLAGAFAVSWLADWGAHVADPFWVSRAYVVGQAALVLVVFLPRETAGLLTLLLVTVGALTALLEPAGPELPLHALCWGLATVVAAEYAPRNLRRALDTYFGLGLLAWAFYVADPGWPSWLTYQSTRALGISLFCWAVWHPVTLEVV